MIYMSASGRGTALWKKTRIMWFNKIWHEEDSNMVLIICYYKENGKTTCKFLIISSTYVDRRVARLWTREGTQICEVPIMRHKANHKILSTQPNVGY